MGGKVARVVITTNFLVFATAASAALVTDGLIIHFDASTLELNDGDPVETWPDVPSGEAFDTVDATVSRETQVQGGYSAPIFKTNVLNGMPIVRFTRDTVTPSNSTVMKSNVWGFPDPAQGATFFAVFSTWAGVNIARMFEFGAPGTAGHMIAADVGEVTQSGYRFNNGYALTQDDRLQPDTYYMGVWQMAQGATYNNPFYALDDLAAMTLTSNFPGRAITYDATGNLITLGAGLQNATTYYQGDIYGGDIAEILIYNKQLNRRQMGETLQYLRDKYHRTRAWNNYPMLAAEDVDPAVVTALSWSTALDPNGLAEINPAIAQHYIFLTESLGADGEPNFAGPAAQIYTVTELSNPTLPVTLQLGKTYYWRVDESVFVAGEPSAPDEPETIRGFVSSFKTLPVVPQIVSEGQPVDVLRFPATHAAYEGDAVLSCVFTTLDPTPVVTWYKTGESNPLTGAEITITTVADVPVAGQWTSTLAIGDVAVADEGSYYCVITDDSGLPALSVTSESADLGVKRLRAHWPLDGNYQDIGPEGHHGEPNKLPDAAQWVAGADPGETGQGLDLVPQPQAAAYAGSWAPSAYTGQVTVSAWVKWAGANGTWQGIVGNRLANAAGSANFVFEIRNNNGNIQIQSPYFTTLTDGNLPVGEWAHAVVTAGHDGMAIYVNGELAASQAGVIVESYAVPVALGSLQPAADGSGLGSPLNGALDDVKIYNYALSHAEVANLYYDVLEIPVCVNPNEVDLSLDVAGGGPAGDEPDCRVNIADLAALATDWLNCGLVPKTACY